MEERRWLEIERRLQWCELKTRTVEEILRFAYEKSNQIWDSLPPSDGGTLPPDPDHPCAGGAVYPLFVIPKYIYSVEGQAKLPLECDVNGLDLTWSTSLEFPDNCVFIKSLEAKVTYDGVETVVYRKIYYRLPNGSTGEEVVIDLTDFKIEPYDPKKPITMCYEYDFHSTGMFLKGDDVFPNPMVLPDGTQCFIPYYFGDINRIVSPSGSPAKLCKSILGEDYQHWQDCTIIGPFRINEQVPDVYSLSEKPEVFPIPDKSREMTYKITLVDFSVSTRPPAGPYIDQDWCAQWWNDFFNTFLNKSVIMKRVPYDCGYTSVWDYSQIDGTVYDNINWRAPAYNATNAFINGLQEVSVVESTSTFCFGEAVTAYSEDKVHSPDNYILVRGFAVRKESIPGKDPENIAGYLEVALDFASRALTCIGLAPVDSTTSEEWWSSEVMAWTKRWDPAWPGIVAIEGSATIQTKWKFEGPI